MNSNEEHDNEAGGRRKQGRTLIKLERNYPEDHNQEESNAEEEKSDKGEGEQKAKEVRADEKEEQEGNSSEVRISWT